MVTATPTSGISTAPAQAAVPAPALPVAPAATNIELPGTWPRAAQRVTAGLLVTSLALLGWHAFVTGPLASRPTTLESGATAFRVDLNRADHAGLLQLPGVGEALASRIEEYRQQYGEFRTADDLRQVRGIGPATLERLRPFVYAQPFYPPEADQPPDAEPEHPAPAPPREPAKRPPEKPSGTKKPAVLPRQVDVNRATVEELQSLPGIGPALSARIVAARGEKPFGAVEDLRRVRGIGPKTLERLRPLVTVEPVQ